MGMDTAVLVVEAVGGGGFMTLVAAAASRGPGEDACAQCGARNPPEATTCRKCGIGIHRNTPA